MDVFYVDLDGTLLGPSGSLLEDAGGAWTLDGVRALEACRDAGVEVVLMSGRTRRTVAGVARLLGLGSYVCELGACVVLDGEPHWLTGDLAPSEQHGSAYEQIERSGAPALLLERFGGRLEPHAPWHRGREVTHLFRGRVDVAQADALLAEHGHGALRLLDNGACDGGRVYHLLPRPASKAAGVAFHRRARGRGRDACAAVGDSPEDLAVAAEVGHVWLVGNALAGGDPALREDLAARAGVSVTEGHHGAGVLEAVRAALEGG
jgi:hydroxymethylpyrimidine pyrophosphatase-like HAD family hydrolase